MHPVLFSIDVPEGLQDWLPQTLTIYSYGFLIAIGAILGISYIAVEGKRKFNMNLDMVNTVFLSLLAAAIVGGKVFMIFENPKLYLSDLSLLLDGRGFVFFGSLSFSIPALLVVLQYYKLPVWPMLDIIAITTGIVHFFGRLGCFMAGCCYGVQWEGPLAVVFTDPLCVAKPLNAELHPTQLYSAGMILLIVVVILVLKKYQKFQGQLFLTYLLLYAIGRSIIEIFRGDEARGFLIDGWFSNSQFFALIFIVVTSYFYWRLLKKANHNS